MAVQQNSLKYFGGQQSGGDSSARQVVIERTDMTTAFTDDEYQRCLSAISLGYAVAVSFGTISGIVRQAQLVSKTNLGALTFSCTRNETVESWTVVASSPHTITHDNYDVDNDITPLVNTGTKIAEGTLNGQQFELFAPSGGGGGGDQIVLVRSDMTTNFTNIEYQDCVDAVTAEKAVCVQFVLSGSTTQAQLTMIMSDGTLVFEFTAENNHYRWNVAPTNNAHSIELVGNIFGVPIFDTLQDAITSEYTLKSGDIFETNGFHTSGDGGAARYKVSSTGTANGMDIVQLAAGKLAKLQFSDWIIPEQMGYQQTFPRIDLVPYIERAIQIGCQHVHLMSSGTGRGYAWKTKLVVNVKGFKLTGEGNWGYPNKFSYIAFVPDNNSVDAMIDIKARAFEVSNIHIDVVGDYVKLVNGFLSTSTNSDENRYWSFNNVLMNSFDKCFYFSEGLKWMVCITNCQLNSCKTGFHIRESSTTLYYFRNVYFSNCDTCDFVIEGNLFTCTFVNCNFGIIRKAVQFTTNSSNYRFQNVNFIGCSFEYDSDNVDYGDSILDFDDDIDQNVALDNCSFTILKRSWTQVPTNQRGIKLGNRTNLALKSCTLLGNDPDQIVPWTPKILWNENYKPVNGGITFMGVQFQVELPDSLIPYCLQTGQSSGRKLYGTLDTENGDVDADTWVWEVDGLEKSTYFNSWNGATHGPANVIGILTTDVVFNSTDKWAHQSLRANLGYYQRVATYSGGMWTWGAWKTFTYT